MNITGIKDCAVMASQMQDGGAKGLCITDVSDMAQLREGLSV